MPTPDLDVHYVAQLARLDLTPVEEEAFSRQLGLVLGYVEKLKELDVEAVAPTAHPAPLENVTRSDTVTSSITNQEALRNAPRHANGLFIVPKIVE